MDRFHRIGDARPCVGNCPGQRAFGLATAPGVDEALGGFQLTLRSCKVRPRPLCRHPAQLLLGHLENLSCYPTRLEKKLTGHPLSTDEHNATHCSPAPLSLANFREHTFYALG